MRSLRYLFLVILCASLSGFGAGFAILEQSTKGMGKAMGGTTADTRDPAAQYFNPSIGAWFDHDEISLGVHFMYVDAFFDDKGSSSYLGTEEGGNVGGLSVIPNINWIHPLGNDFVLGFSISGTSGTKTEHNKYWIGRYTAQLTDVAVLDFSPMLSYKINDQWSIGAGLVFEYAQAQMDSYMDFGAAAGSGHRDGKTKISGDSSAVGYVLGITYKPVKGTTLGLGYRSEMRHDFDMKIRSHYADDIAKARGWRTQGNASTVLHFPASLNFGIEQEITEAWRVGLDISYYFQHCMKDMRLKFEDGYMSHPAGYEQRTDMKWRDSWRISLGQEYDINNQWTVRCGVAWDQTPVPNKYRNTQLPDADRYWFSAGCTYKMNKNWRFDFAWTHLIFQMVSINQNGGSSVNPDAEIHGKFGGDVDTISIGATYSF